MSIRCQRCGIPDPTPTTPPSPPPAVPAVASQALGNAGLVNPTIVLNPVGPQVTNFQSWLAISPADWHPVTATADDGGVDVTVIASPTAVDWNLGNGASLSCAGPGVLYDPSKPDNEQSTYCSYTWPPPYDQPGGTYNVTATIEYQVTTNVTGAANTTPNLGTHFGPTAHRRGPSDGSGGARDQRLRKEAPPMSMTQYETNDERERP